MWVSPGTDVTPSFFGGATAFPTPFHTALRKQPLPCLCELSSSQSPLPACCGRQRKPQTPRPRRPARPRRAKGEAFLFLLHLLQPRKQNRKSSPPTCLSLRLPRVSAEGPTLCKDALMLPAFARDAGLSGWDGLPPASSPAELSRASAPGTTRPRRRARVPRSFVNFQGLQVWLLSRPSRCTVTCSSWYANSSKEVFLP